MLAYRVAEVNFSENGATYPVNADFRVKPDEFVIVRLSGKYTPLHKAKVISVDYQRAKCKHSIVCKADDASAYGAGPDGVSTEEGLDRFLLGFMKMTKCPVVWRRRDSSTAQYDPHHRWDWAYFQHDVFGTRSNGMAFATKLILLGRDEILHKSPGKAERIWMHGEAINGDYDHGTIINAPNGTIYRRAAEIVEADLKHHEIDDPRLLTGSRIRNRELEEIKDVVGGDGYLSDDVYL